MSCALKVPDGKKGDKGGADVGDDAGMNPDFWEKILEASPIGLCVLGADGQILSANARAREIMGMDLDEMTQRDYHSPEWDITDLEGKPVGQGEFVFERVKRTGEPLNGVKVMVRRLDNTRIVVSANAVPLRDDSGRFDGLILAFEDITQRTRLEELVHHSERLEKILESVPIGVQLVDADGLNVYANQRAQEILGLSFDEIKRRYSHSPEWRLTDLDGNPLRPEDRIFSRVKESLLPLYDQKLMVQRPDGRWIAISVNAQPLFDESRRFSGLAAVHEDITERLLLEKELTQHREQLEETVKQRTLRLQEINRQLELEIGLRQEREAELEHANEQLQALSRFVQAARENEKSRSAFRVHDELGQNLMVLKMALKGLEKDLLAGKEAAGAMRSIYAIMNQMLGQVYAISAELRPPILDDVGLGAALEWQAQEFHDRTGHECVVAQDLGDAVIGLEVSTAVFRIFQEILDNLALRSGIGTVQAKIKLEDDWLIMSIENDGECIEEKDLQEANPLSFVFMREYAGRFGGDVGIIASKERGTTVELRVPV